jgi:hypothetical protein
VEGTKHYVEHDLEPCGRCNQHPPAANIPKTHNTPVAGSAVGACTDCRVWAGMGGGAGGGQPARLAASRPTCALCWLLRRRAPRMPAADGTGSTLATGEYAW